MLTYQFIIALEILSKTGKNLPRYTILKIYSNKINGALEKKETEFQGHLNFSAGLSNSIDDLQKSLKSIEQRITDANNFEKETKSSLLEKIGSDQRKIDSLMATQEKLQELFPTMSKQSDVEALSRAINSTYTDEQNIQKKLNLNMANIQKKLQKQRFLLTSLAEETASGFSNVLTKLGSANVTIKNLKEQLRGHNVGNVSKFISEFHLISQFSSYN